MTKIITEPSPEDQKAALDAFFQMARASRAAAKQAAEELEKQSSILIDAIRTGSGQSEKVSRIIWSVWNGTHQTGLCDDLAGLDYAIGCAVLALIAARIHMSGDADPLIQRILIESGEWNRLDHDLEEPPAA